MRCHHRSLGLPGSHRHQDPHLDSRIPGGAINAAGVPIAGNVRNAQPRAKAEIPQSNSAC